MKTKETHRAKHSFLQGALILSIAALIVKIIGAIFKIPLANILGGDGMGYFSTAYDMYMPIYVLSNAGLPIAVARVVAESSSKGRFRDVRKTLRLANIIFLITGTIGCCIMLFGAHAFVNYIKNPGAYLAVMTMAPTVFFVCLTCSFRGYYEGLQNMYPTALSQVVEAIVKLLLGLGLSMWIYKTGMNSFETTGVVFGKVCADYEAAKLIVLQYAAAGAIAGVAIGALCAAAAIYIRHKLVGDKISQAELLAPQDISSSKTIVKRIIKIAIPIALGSCVGQLTGVIDLFSVLRRLHFAVESNSGAVLSMYGNAIPAGKALDAIPNYLNGCYKGLAVTLYNLIPTFTVAMGISALPPVTVAWETRNMQALKRNVESVLRVTLLFALPAGLGMSFLSKEILMLLYGGRPNEVAVAAPLLAILGMAVIFSATCSPINSMLQAIGHAYLPLIIMAGCSFTKIIINNVLVGIPTINIRGAAIGTLICYILIMSISVFFLFRITKVKPNIVSIFIKPLVSALLCATSALGTCRLLSMFLSQNLSTVIGIAIGGVVYIAALILFRAITEEDILMLPKGDKIMRIYHKLPGIRLK